MFFYQLRLGFTLKTIVLLQICQLFKRNGHLHFSEVKSFEHKRLMGSPFLFGNKSRGAEAISTLYLSQVRPLINKRAGSLLEVFPTSEYH